MVIPPTTIQEETTEFSSVSIFPNPATDQINIDSKDIEWYYVSIHNVNGKTVMMLPQPEKDVPIQVSSLPKGFYTIRMTDMKTKQVIVRSFVK